MSEKKFDLTSFLENEKTNLNFVKEIPNSMILTTYFTGFEKGSCDNFGQKRHLRNECFDKPRAKNNKNQINSYHLFIMDDVYKFKLTNKAKQDRLNNTNSSDYGNTKVKLMFFKLK